MKDEWPDEYQYYLEVLYAQDACYLVDVLDISSEEIIEAFPRKVDKHIREEYL